MQDTLTYRHEWIEMINTLPDENDRNALIAAITLYQFNGQIPDISPVLNLVFLFIKKEIDTILLQIKVEKERKEARRAKRMAKPRPQKTEQPVEIPRTQQAPVMKGHAPESTLTTPHEESSMPEAPTINHPKTKTTTSSRNKKFNSLIKAKERHDRNREKQRGHPHGHVMEVGTP